MRSLRIVLVLAASQLTILARMRAILLVLLLPGIVMYTVFTFIFSGPAGRVFHVAVVDHDKSAASRKLVEMLEFNQTNIIEHEDCDPTKPILTEETAVEAIRDNGRFRVVIVIPKGYENAPNTISGPSHQGIRMFYDETQPMEAEVVKGMLQMAAGRALFQRLTARSGDGNPAATNDQDDEEKPGLLVKVREQGVAINRMTIASKHTFLAGIVPMFILFGATGGARSLLEAVQSGEVRRLLASPIRPTHILFGQMVSSVIVTFVQCYVMYLYAWLVFGVAIWDISGGLLLLTICTCLAATSLGMFMASFCRTGQQLDAIGTMIILAMSAIGGSMVPRFVMPLFMQKMGLFTINGWAYDGFIALIRNQGLPGIALPCIVLVSVTLVLACSGCALLTSRMKAQPSV